MSADLNPLSSDALLASPALAGAEFRSIADHGTPTVVTSAQVAAIQRTNELVFVDTATPDYQQLIDGMRESALGEGRHLEFVLIDQDRDGIRKITDTLATKSRPPRDPHHQPRERRLGAAGEREARFRDAGEARDSGEEVGRCATENGDILLYGCDLAASQEGKSLLEAMSRLTGADVAASEDLTGAASKGGDWDLEFRTGTIETTVAIGARQPDWNGTLQATAVGVETRANTTTTGSQETNTLVQPRTVAMDQNGNYVVVWFGNGDQTGQVDSAGIFAQRFDANGVAQDTEFRVNSTTGNVQSNPAVAMDANGNFVVAWTSVGQDGSVDGVYAQRFDAAGAAQGVEFRVNTFTTGSQRAPLIAMNASGSFVIAWDSTGQDGGGRGRLRAALQRRWRDPRRRVPRQRHHRRRSVGRQRGHGCRRQFHRRLLEQRWQRSRRLHAAL